MISSAVRLLAGENVTFDRTTKNSCSNFLTKCSNNNVMTMPSVQDQCSFFQCTEIKGGNDVVSFHRFPRNHDKQKIWLKRSGNRNLLSLNPQKLPQRSICSSHFRIGARYSGAHRTKIYPYENPLESLVQLTDEEVNQFYSNNGPVHLPAVPVADTSSSVGANTSDKLTSSDSAITSIIVNSEATVTSTTVVPPDVHDVSSSSLLNDRVPCLEEPVDSRKKGGPPKRMSLNRLAASMGIKKKKKDLKKETTTALRSAQDWRQQALKLKNKLEQAKRLNSNHKLLTKKGFMNQLEEMLISPAAKLILEGEIKNYKRVTKDGKKNGRKWSLKEKIFYLGIYKRSRSTYAWLYELLTIPSPKTLQNLLHEFHLEPGICQPVLDHLKLKAQKKLKRLDKYCTLMLDEVGIKEGLYLNLRTGQVEGLEDLGKHGRTTSCANKALVFMLRGIKSKWKMPVAYYFTHSTITKEMLAKLIPDIIRACKEAGFTVLATVSDQGPTNRGAVSILRSNCEEGAYESLYYVDDMKIIHIWDVPHILKNIRNNLLTSDLYINDTIFAQWQHIIDFYEYERTNLGGKSGLRFEHVYPAGRNKMRVKLAAQPMSESTCNKMESIIIASEGKKLSHCVSTLLIFALIDVFFDLTNGAGPSDKPKPMRCKVTASSPHHKFWNVMLDKLKTWRYVHNSGEKKGQAHRPPCLQGWMDDVKGFQRLWKTCQQLGFKSLDLRRLNQDPLENFFATIRQCNGSNRNPTCNQFTSAFKTAVVNNLSSSKSLNKNCADDGDELLTDMHSFFRKIHKDKKNMKKVPQNNKPELLRGKDIVYHEIEKTIKTTKFSKLCRQHPASVCNSIINDISKMKPFSKCDKCISCLSSDDFSSDHLLIQASQMPLVSRYADIFSARQISLREPLNLSGLGSRQEDTSYIRPEILQIFLSLRAEFLSNSFKLLSSYNVLATLHEMCLKFNYDWLCDVHRDELRDILIRLMSKSLVQLTCQNFNRKLREKERQKWLKKKLDEAAKKGNDWKALYAERLKIQNESCDNEDDDDEWVTEDVLPLVETDQAKSILSMSQRLAKVSNNPEISSYFTLDLNDDNDEHIVLSDDELEPPVVSTLQSCTSSAALCVPPTPKNSHTKSSKPPTTTFQPNSSSKPHIPSISPLISSTSSTPTISSTSSTPTIPSTLQKLNPILPHSLHTSKHVDQSKPSLPPNQKPVLFENPKYVLSLPEKVDIGWKRKLKPGSGLINLGNTCYLNSVLQLLFHTPAFVEWLLQDSHRNFCKNVNCVTCATVNTLIQTHEHSKASPILVRNLLQSISKDLTPGRQEDAHEFMRCLLASIETEYLMRFKNLCLDQLSKETTPVNQIFGGYMRVETICQLCLKISTKFDHFCDISLDIEQRNVTSLVLAVREHFKETPLSAGSCENNNLSAALYSCSACSKLVPAIQRKTIERAPKLLCLHMKRFNPNTGRKILKKITVEPLLLLSTLKYRLIGIIDHVGSTSSSGHYTASAKCADNQFYCFDDGRQAHQESMKVLLNKAATAYILLFELCPHDKRPNTSGSQSASKRMKM